MKNLLKLSLSLGAVGIMVLGLLAFTNDRPSSADATDLVKTFSVGSDAELEVTTSGGRIEVVGGNGNEVAVTAIVKKGMKVLDFDTDAWHEALEGYELIIEKQGNKVIAYAKRENGSNRSWGRNNTSISFEVDVPRTISSVLRTSGGRIHLEQVSGEQDAKTSGGAIQINNTAGPITAKTSGGGITVLNQNGDLYLRTSGGRISVENATGDVDAKTSGGGITLMNTDGEVEVGTSGGSIKIDGVASRLEATTSGGGIRANISGIEESIYLKTSGASIHATLERSQGMDLDLSGNSIDIDLNNFSGSHKRNKVKGTINGGGIPVYMHTSGGRVECDFR